MSIEHCPHGTDERPTCFACFFGDPDKAVGEQRLAWEKEVRECDRSDPERCVLREHRHGLRAIYERVKEMRYIEGAKFHVTGAELKKHCDAQAKHHQERWEYYKKETKRHEEEMAKYKDAAEAGEELGKAAYSSNSGLRNTALQGMQQHYKKFRRFEFLAKHVEEDETRLLSVDELEQLSLIRGQWE